MRNLADICKGAMWALGMGLIVQNYLGSVLFDQLWWSLIAISLVTAPTMISIFQEEDPHKTLLWIVLLSVSLRSIPPLNEGNSCFMIDADAAYQFQVAEIYTQKQAWTWGLETERAREIVFFPVLHILSVQISAISGLPLYQVCRFLPLILTIPILMFVFQTYALLLDPRAAVYASLLFSICYKYNWFDGNYLQESLGILFFVMAFYSIASKTGMLRRHRSIALIFFFSALLLAMTHFFSSLLLVTTLALSLALSYAQSQVRKGVFLNVIGIRAGDAMLALVIFASWLGFVAVVPMLVGVNYAADYLSALLRFLSDPFRPQIVPPPTGIHLSFQESLIVYTGFLVAGGLGLVGVIEGILDTKKRDGPKEGVAMARILNFATIAFLLGVPAVIGIFLSPPDNPDVPSRFIPFVYFFWSPTFGAGVCFIRRLGPRLLKRIPILESKAYLISLSKVCLLILPVASTWLLLPSYMQRQAKLDDQEVRTLSSWLLCHGDKSVTLMGDSIMTAATAALARQQSTHGRLGDTGKLLNGILYYNENMNDLVDFLSKQPAVYILVNEAYLSHKYYLITWFYESKPPPSCDDMASSLQKINSLCVLNRVYGSPSVTLYVSLRR